MTENTATVGKRKFDLRALNPVGFQLYRFIYNPDIRLIILYGGSSSGKSYSAAQIILMTLLWDGDNTLVMRKVGASISKTIYEDFKAAARQLRIYHRLKFKDSVRQITCLENDGKIDFSGIDDPEKIKGISNYRRVFLDEWSEYEEDDFKQIRKRLRGKRGQQIITAFNPISESHWIKRNVFDRERWNDIDMTVTLKGVRLNKRYTRVKGLRINSPKPILNPRTGDIEEHAPDTVVIHSTYLNNFWVVGSPDGTYGYYDEQCIADFEKDRTSDPDYYNVYALGEWGVLRTGSEFFGSFNRACHCRPCPFDPSLPVHVSVDNNVLPYISFTFWQADTSGGGCHIRQIDEVCAGNPDNTVRRAARLAAEKIKGWGPERVYLHGDASTRAANTFDEQKRSWIDLLIDALKEEGVDVEDCVGNKNPSVPLTGEFVNAILDGAFTGVSLTIGNNCKASADDYLSVQKDVNGAILKVKVKDKVTKQTYEEHGHLSDTLRYVVVDFLKDLFTTFSNSRKRNLYARDGFVNFFNPSSEGSYTEDVLYLCPDIGGRMLMVHGKKCGHSWHVIGACLCETSSTEEMCRRVADIGAVCVAVECGRPYYPLVRELRVTHEDVRLVPETSDTDRRIAATSDFVRHSVLFAPLLAESSPEYAAFMGNLMDYNRETGSREASIALSGFVRFVVKSFPDTE